MFKNDPTRDKY